MTTQMRETKSEISEIGAAKREATLDPKNLAAIRLLDSWSEATPEEIGEQRATWDVVKKGLTEHPARFRTGVVEE